MIRHLGNSSWIMEYLTGVHYNWMRGAGTFRSLKTMNYVKLLASFLHSYFRIKIRNHVIQIYKSLRVDDPSIHLTGCAEYTSYFLWFHFKKEAENLAYANFSFTDSDFQHCISSWGFLKERIMTEHLSLLLAAMFENFNDIWSGLIKILIPGSNQIGLSWLMYWFPTRDIYLYNFTVTYQKQ